MKIYQVIKGNTELLACYWNYNVYGSLEEATKVAQDYCTENPYDTIIAILNEIDVESLKTNKLKDFFGM